jgi:carbon-monoxide dehydrogenase small subunit
MKYLIELKVNGRVHELAVPARRTLAEALRQELGLTGTKQGCGEGECGACTVLLDGQPVSSCLILAAEAQGHAITTIEGLAEDGELSPVQQAFVEHGGIQCGFCSPGMILGATALLAQVAQPDEQQIRHALSGNLCRCTGYQKIVESVDAAAGLLAARKGGGR